MDSYHILNLLHLVTAVYAGTHSLWYFVTVTVGPSPFPEVVMVGMVDDVPVEYYDSNDKKMTMRQPWHSEEDGVVYAQMKHFAIADIAHNLKSRLQRMIDHFNHSHTLHTYQRISGCELDDDGTVRFQAKDSYNGEAVLFYNMQSDAWSSPFPEIQNASWREENYKGLNGIYQTFCKRTLESYLQQGRSFLNRRVSPRVRVLRKPAGSAGGIEVTCLATGFYPRHIELSLRRDGQPLAEQELIRGDVLPNCDWTYQLRMGLRVSAAELRKGHRYTCSARHVSMDNKLEITWDSQQKPSAALISGTSITALCAVLLFITGIVVWRKRRSQVQEYGWSEKSEEETERINAAEVAAKDAEGGVEMEIQEVNGRLNNNNK